MRYTNRICTICDKSFKVTGASKKQICSKECREIDKVQDGTYETERYYQYRVKEMEKMHLTKLQGGLK